MESVTNIEKAKFAYGVVKTIIARENVENVRFEQTKPLLLYFADKYNLISSDNECKKVIMACCDKIYNAIVSNTKEDYDFCCRFGIVSTMMVFLQSLCCDKSLNSFNSVSALRKFAVKLPPIANLIWLQQHIIARIKTLNIEGIDMTKMFLLDNTCCIDMIMYCIDFMLPSNLTLEKIINNKLLGSFRNIVFIMNFLLTLYEVRYRCDGDEKGLQTQFKEFENICDDLLK